MDSPHTTKIQRKKKDIFLFVNNHNEKEEKKELHCYEHHMRRAEKMAISVKSHMKRRSICSYPNGMHIFLQHTVKHIQGWIPEKEKEEGK